MSNFISNILIDNFKSIRHFEIPNCKRINLFIGRPNVGKSNIIEALSLFSVPFLSENSSKKLSNLIRVENEAELFFSGNYEKQATIQTNESLCILSYHAREGLTIHLDILGNAVFYYVDANLNVKKGRTDKVESSIKRYDYKSDVVYKKHHAKYLIPPFGINLLAIIENNKDLKKEVKGMFEEYNLQIAFDKASQTIKIMQSNNDGIFLIPYNSIADTLQRIIFYKAAIVSNNESVLLFEEPEAHSFPPYMSRFTQEMIAKKANQYFIATHSPFILNDLLENSRAELSVYIVDYKNKQTEVKQLEDRELHDVFQFGVDLFTNNESYI